MSFHSVKLRVKELAEAMSVETEDIITICIMLNIPANSPLSSLTITQCKQITDYYEDETTKDKKEV